MWNNSNKATDSQQAWNWVFCNILCHAETGSPGDSRGALAAGWNSSQGPLEFENFVEHFVGRLVEIEPFSTKSATRCPTKAYFRD
jgi:hypothetical protein